jgi:hypothetical protein
MQIAIHPVSYRAGIGSLLEVKSISGNPPLNIEWVITTDTGSVLESGIIAMSQAQWNDWPSGNDNNYIENITAGLLGVAPV